MSVSINDSDFVENFDIGNMTVGIIGYGYVGQAIASFFSTECKALVYDKFKDGLDTLEDVVRESHAIFVCVPTPMNADGSCHTDIVSGVLSDIVTVCKALDRDASEFVVVIKSTVAPGFTYWARSEFGLRIVFSPEFLTEKNSIKDFENAKRIVLGGSEDDARVIFKLFERKFGAKAHIVQCDTTVAEMTKLFTNAFLMTKVLFANEMYQVCLSLGVDYDEMMTLACLDPRIAYSHLKVPGHDGQLGAGGHCFPKDINNLRSVARRLGTNERLFTAVIERNDELREHKDWLDMRGRAVVEDYGKEKETDDSSGLGWDAVHSEVDGDVPRG